jgi:energy-coupling factor transporter transmembrane protein EcfT
MEQRSIPGTIHFNDIVETIFNESAAARRGFFPADPRLALLAAILLMAAAFLSRRVDGQACLLVYLLGLHLLSGCSPRFIWKRLGRIMIFALLAVLLNAVLVKGEPLLTIWGRAIMSWEGLTRGIYFFLQILVLYLTVVLFLTVTSREDIARGLGALLKPVAPDLAGKFSLYAFLSIGFLPLFAGEFERISLVQRFRGGGLEGGLLKKIRGVRLLLVPLILSAIHRSSQLAMVVELRGLKRRFGDLVTFAPPPLKDYLLVMATGLVIAFIFLLLPRIGPGGPV